jgi:hypothetical protein
MEATATAIETGEAPRAAGGWRRAAPKATRGLAVEGAMAAYGTGMLCWLAATIMAAPDAAGNVSLAPLSTVFACWAAGTVPAYLLARLATRRLPAA